MKQPKFTPGPWTLFKGANSETCLTSGETHLETLVSGEANARLIAAAPELLEALNQIVYGPHAYNDIQMREIARKAIAKATGCAE